MSDNSLMPFGVHKGTKLANVPASYLIWVYENLQLREDLKIYIQKNLDVLKKEAKAASKASRR